MSVSTSVWLYDLPLYEDYSNVYDIPFSTFINSSSELLVNKCQSVINSHLLDSIVAPSKLITPDKYVVFTIHSDKAKLQHTTYIVFLIETNNIKDYYYYFVSNTRFEPSTNTITFELSRDVWQSNLDYIRGTKYLTSVATPQQLTNIDVDFNDTMSVVNLTDAMSYITSSSVNITSYTNEIYQNVILWIRLLVDDTYPKLPTITTSTPYSPLQLIYIPYASISLNGEISRIFSSVAYYSGDGYKSIPVTYTSYFTDEQSSHIISKEICTNTPFIVNYDSSISAPVVSGNIEFFTDEIERTCILVKNPNFTLNDRLLDSEKIKIVREYTDYYPKTDNLNDIRYKYGNLDLPAFSVVNPAVLKYPFYRRAIRIGSKEVSIPPMNNKTIMIEKHLSWLDDNYLIINFGSNNTKFPLNERRTLVINKDALTEYLRSNSASLIAGSVFSTAKGLTTIATAVTPGDVVKGAVGMAEGLFTPLTKMLDLENSPDTVIQSKDSFFDIGSLSYVKKSIVAKVPDEIEYYSTIFDMSGIPYNGYVDIFEQNHLYYDFYKISDVSHVKAAYAEDLPEIKKILSSGIRIWHPVYSYDTVRVINNIDVKPILEFAFSKYNYDIGIRGTLWTEEDKA